MRRSLHAILLAGFTAIFFCGCNSTKFMVDNMVPVTEKMNLAVNSNPDIELVGEAIPAGLLQLEGFLAASPDNRKFLLQLAEGYNGYAFAFLEDNDPERAERMYRRANDYAMRILAREEVFAEAVNKPLDEYEAALKAFDEDDVPAMFYMATAQLSLIGINLDDPEVFLALPKVKALAERIVELNETFFYGGGHALLGVYYASRSTVTGGEPEKAKAHFNRAFEISDGRFLPFYLLYAEYYAYQIQDRELYVGILENDVLKKPADILPERAFINAVAREKATAMLEMTDDLF